MDLVFVLRVQILDFMSRLVAVNIDAVGQYRIRFALQQMLAFAGRDLADGRKIIA